MKGLNSKLLQSAAVGALAITAMPAQAQIEEIVVTAEKREQSVQDVPISIQVVPGEDLQERQISSAEDFAGSLPNVLISKDSVSKPPAARISSQLRSASDRVPSGWLCRLVSGASISRFFIGLPRARGSGSNSLSDDISLTPDQNARRTYRSVKPR